MPNRSATAPNKGGASKKTTNDNWAKEATFTADDLSVNCAAAEMVSGNITAVPLPIKQKPIKAMRG